jgi:hypothetical protein
MGEEFLRQMIHIDVLTMRAEPELKTLLLTTNVVVNDARFENDRNNLHEWLDADRVDVKTNRKKNDDAKWRSHTSELSRPENEDIEYTIKNDEEWPFPSLAVSVHKMIIDMYGF